jgi:hypothetical protein
VSSEIPRRNSKISVSFSDSLSLISLTKSEIKEIRNGEQDTDAGCMSFVNQGPF